MLYSRLLSPTATPATGSTVEFLERVAEIPTDQLPIQFVLVDIAIAVAATVTNCKATEAQIAAEQGKLDWRWSARKVAAAARESAAHALINSCILHHCIELFGRHFHVPV